MDRGLIFKLGVLVLSASMLARGQEKISRAILAANGPVTAVVQFAENVGQPEADEVLRDAGVRLIQNPDLLDSHRLVEGESGSLTQLGQSERVVAVYAASYELIAGIPVRGCAGSVQESGFAASYSDQPVDWLATVNGVTMSWSLTKPTDQMPADKLKEIVHRALAEWSKSAFIDFEFRTTSGGPKNISIEFLTGAHGDGYPFDGRGGFLAHAFYPVPVNPDPIASDLHLDDAETWVDGGNPDLYSVVLHEIGHSLGLQHSSTPGSVMYPYYRLLTRLQANDLAALRKLYPARPEAGAGTGPVTLSINAPGPVTSDSTDITGTAAGTTGTVEVTWATASGSGKAEGGTSWRARSVPLVPGVNTIAITALDSTGARAMQSVSVTRVSNPAPAPPPTRDTVAPSLTITFPSTTVYGTSATTLRIAGTARDAVGVAQVSWQCGTTTGVATGTTAWSFELPLKPGDNQVIVRARDEAGNSSWRSFLVTRR